MTFADKLGVSDDVVDPSDDVVDGLTVRFDTDGLEMLTCKVCQADQAPVGEPVAAAQPWMRHCTVQPSDSSPDGTSTLTCEPEALPAPVPTDQIAPMPCSGRAGSWRTSTFTPTVRPSGSATFADRLGVSDDVTAPPGTDMDGVTVRFDTDGLAMFTCSDCQADHGPSPSLAAARPWMRHCTVQPSDSSPDGTSTLTCEPEALPAPVPTDQIIPLP